MGSDEQQVRVEHGEVKLEPCSSVEGHDGYCARLTVGNVSALLTPEALTSLAGVGANLAIKYREIFPAASSAITTQSGVPVRREG